jgi:hypothetical protein
MVSRVIKEVGIGVAIAALIFLWLLREELGALGLSPVSRSFIRNHHRDGYLARIRQAL